MTDPELTRRRWLLRLGETVVLTGFSGIVLEGAEAPDLPAGLYLPSIDHLAHVMARAQTSNLGPAAPQFFNADDFRLVTKLTALILGEEPGTPPIPEIAQWLDLIVGHSAAVRKAALDLTPANRRLAVDFYGKEMVKELEDTEPQPLCREGMKKLHEGSFLNLTEGDQLSMLRELEASADPFLRWLKERVIDGFYTSKEGLKELDYKGNSFYSESPGCEHA
jgi:hypothetical protein